MRKSGEKTVMALQESIGSGQVLGPAVARNRSHHAMEAPHFTAAARCKARPAGEL